MKKPRIIKNVEKGRLYSYALVVCILITLFALLYWQHNALSIALTISPLVLFCIAGIISYARIEPSLIIDQSGIQIENTFIKWSSISHIELVGNSKNHQQIELFIVYTVNNRMHEISLLKASLTINNLKRDIALRWSGDVKESIQSDKHQTYYNSQSVQK